LADHGGDSSACGCRSPGPEDLNLLKVLAGRDKDMLDATGVARRHAGRLDIPSLERTLRPICELAEDMVPWSRLQRVLAAVRSQHA